MEETSDDDSYDSFFNINLNQYPNLTANFSFETSHDTAQHQPLFNAPSHLQTGYDVQQQSIQLPQHPVPHTHQQQQSFSPVNVNLLSYQPLPRGNTQDDKQQFYSSEVICSIHRKESTYSVTKGSIS